MGYLWLIMIIYGQLYHEYREYALINVNHLDEFRWFTMAQSGFNQQESGFNQQMNLGVHPKWKQMEHDGISCVFGETVKSPTHDLSITLETQDIHIYIYICNQSNQSFKSWLLGWMDSGLFHLGHPPMILLAASGNHQWSMEINTTHG